MDLTCRAAWERISGRIRGLEKAAEVHAGFLASHSGSPYGADKALQTQCEGILSGVVDFQTHFGNALPVGAMEALQRFLADGGSQIHGNTAGDALLVRTILVKLVAFESEMSFSLADPMESVRSTTELAFMHLQRLIVVDDAYRAKWQEAFQTRETHCERLGGVHLLWHGIWAFKVDATGGRTDLVYQEPLKIAGTRAMVPLVLTEWKLAKGAPSAAYDTARRQTSIYSAGVLAGLELADCRYLIAVTEKGIAPPDDTLEGGVRYRHINIAVAPEKPSKAAAAS